MQNKKYIVAISLIAIFAVAFGIASAYQNQQMTMYINSQLGMLNSIDNNPTEGKTDVHCRIRIYDGNNQLVLDEYHAGVVTDLGDNMTLAKLFADADYNMTQYNMNVTYISIGNQGSLSTASTILPGEWNRTALTVEDEGASQLNATCTFYPDNSGPYTADCIGLNIESGIGTPLSLFAYDVFSEVTGIDETFTINVEFQISVSHT